MVDLTAALSTDHRSNLHKVNWGPPVGLIYAFAESLRYFNIAFVKIPVETSHLMLLVLPHKATSVRSIPECN